MRLNCPDSTSTLTIDVTYSGSQTAAAIAVLAVKGLQSAAVIDTDANDNDTIDLALDAPALGIIVASTINGLSGISAGCTWTNATEFQDEILDEGTTDFGMSSAYYLASADQANYAIQADWAQTGTATGSAASFR